MVWYGRSSTLALTLSCLAWQEIVVIENVAKRGTATVVSEALIKDNYEVKSYFCNSCGLGLPQSRTRLYVVGVARDKVKLVHDSASWSSWMEE